MIEAIYIKIERKPWNKHAFLVLKLFASEKLSGKSRRTTNKDNII
jgi:hypothetical protein